MSQIDVTKVISSFFAVKIVSLTAIIALHHLIKNIHYPNY